ncbi:uncharacterized protein LOC132281652 [Cornus florida]|uniref:uncharacterized protein LOC132281652 n=1 Tax=Cornus florida TaxID=4283 RepID=UPI0028A23C60|nr:uncharacterized protein LOC132281652 [Cornus florida]
MKKQFHFDARWILEDQCCDIIARAWCFPACGSHQFCWVSKLKSCKQLQRAESLLSSCWLEEELYWKQKSRNQWLQFGDRNSKFFHATTKRRRAKNAIIGIRDDLGFWQEKETTIHSTFLNYFQNLFQTSSPMAVDSFLQHVPCRISTEMNNALLGQQTKLEIKQTVFSMAPLKAPAKWLKSIILITHEVLHYLKNKRKGEKAFMALKLDMSKAYDRIEWPFSLPLSLALHRAQQARVLTGLSIRWDAPVLSHLFFADDSIIFYQASIEEVQSLKHILNCYKQAFGQMINFSKSAIFFSKNTSRFIRSIISHLLGISVEGFHARYLGVPALVGRSKRDVFQFVLHHMQDRLAFWNKHCLSAGVKEILIKAVLSALLTYLISSFRLPRSLCLDLSKCVRNFWWCKKQQSCLVHWVNWEDLCASKNSGGLCFRNFEAFNSALMAKHAWNFQVTQRGIAFHLLKAKYFPSYSFLEASLGSNPSWGWQSIWFTQELFRKGLMWSVGNGQSIDIWNDRWIPGFSKTHPFQPAGAYLFKVADLIDMQQASWNRDILTLVFLPHEVVVISKCQFSLRNKTDSYIWALETSGRFTVKSAYHLAMSLHCPTLVGVGKIWKEIWHCKTLSKINHFLWRCCHDVLSLGSTRLHRRFTNDAMCPHCEWLLSLPTLASGRMECTSLMSLVSFCCWFLWKACNMLIFEGALWNPSFVASKAVQSFWEFFDSQKCWLNVHLTPKPSVSPVSWSPPPFASSPLVAEVFAFRLAVMWARVFDFRHVWFECDTKNLVEALQVASRYPSIIAPCIYDIRTDLDLFSWVKVSHVRWQGNRAAHALASLSSSCLCADSVISQLSVEVL